MLLTKILQHTSNQISSSLAFVVASASSSSTSVLRTTRRSFPNDGLGKFGIAKSLLTAVQLFGECGCRENWRKRANCLSDSFTCNQKLLLIRTLREGWSVNCCPKLVCRNMSQTFPDLLRSQIVLNDALVKSVESRLLFITCQLNAVVA